METSTTSLPESLQTTLQTARKSRRLSQLELALPALVSQQPCKLCGKRPCPAQPRTAAELAARTANPSALRNVACAAAGLGLRLSTAVALADAVRLPRCAMTGLSTLPAMVMDAAWNVLHMNHGAQWLATTLMPWMADLPPGQSVNMIDAMLHPEGMTQHITNLEEVALALLAYAR